MKTIKTNDDLIPVSRFIGESERNIEIANVIYEQYEDAREDILRGFFERLAAGLKAKLPDWSSRYTEAFFTTRYGAFDLFKSAWLERYTIRVEAYDWGHGVIYGVWRDAESLHNIPLNAKLFSTVKGKFPQTTSRAYYEAEIPMLSPAKDWRTPNALWRVHSDDKFRAEVESLLLEIANLTEAQIDLMVKKQKSAK